MESDRRHRPPTRRRPVLLSGNPLHQHRQLLCKSAVPPHRVPPCVLLRLVAFRTATLCACRAGCINDTHCMKFLLQKHFKFQVRRQHPASTHMAHGVVLIAHEPPHGMQLASPSRGPTWIPCIAKLVFRAVRGPRRRAADASQQFAVAANPFRPTDVPGAVRMTSTPRPNLFSACHAGASRQASSC